MESNSCVFKAVKDGYWYFWDETWSNDIGPYLSEEHANESATAYGQFLDDGVTSDPHLIERHELRKKLNLPFMCPQCYRAGQNWCEHDYQ